VNFIVFLVIVYRDMCFFFFFFLLNLDSSLFYVDSVFNVIYALRFKAFVKEIAIC
jgi:hypothetical protein